MQYENENVGVIAAAGSASTRVGVLAGVEAEKRRNEAHAKYEAQQARDRDTALRLQAVKQALKLASLQMEPTNATLLDDADAIYAFISNKENEANE